MRDASAAYWFSVGDKVEVLDDVVKGGHSLKGRIGTVTEAWEKCDVDPTCCCAEQVDQDLAVRVYFQGSEESNAVEGSFQHYFNEAELKKVAEVLVESKDTVAFDGLSCKAFKLEQLEAQRNAAAEAREKD